MIKHVYNDKIQQLQNNKGVNHFSYTWLLYILCNSEETIDFTMMSFLFITEQSSRQREHKINHLQIGNLQNS